MTARAGVVSFAADPDAGTTITPAWCESIKALGVSRVRVPIRAGSQNQLPIALYQQAARIYRDAGIEMCAVLAMDLNRPWLAPTPRLFYPNQQLGYRANHRQNQWILDTCRRAEAVASALAPLGVVSYSVYNEPNLAALLMTGANVPPAADSKAPALSAEVFGSLAYELAGYLHAGGATAVELGALSWIAGSGPDPKNPYCAGYLSRALGYLRATGAQHLPWSAVSVNAEGVWSAETAAAMAKAIQDAVGAELPIVVGEWSWPAGSAVDAVKARATFDALSSVASEVYFFQHPLQQADGRGYGLQGWTVADGIVPTAYQSPWYAVLLSLLQPTVPAPPMPNPA